MIKKRNLILAALLSLLVPGLGHVYAGDAKKGGILVGIEFGLLLLGGLAGVLSTFYGMAFFILFIISFYIFVIISSVKLANKNSEYFLKPYNRWYWYLVIWVVMTAITNAIFSYRGMVLGYETYSMFHKSMVPTLQVGDYITVNTRYKHPSIGDVVVFQNSKDRNIPYVKRVVAIGNDLVSIKDGEVIRNGKIVHELSIEESRRKMDFSISMTEVKVPENEIFLLGDWRDISRDSRFWGTVPNEDVIGKVTYIWYSKDVSRIGKKVK